MKRKEEEEKKKRKNDGNSRKGCFCISKRRKAHRVRHREMRAKASEGTKEIAKAPTERFSLVDFESKPNICNLLSRR